MTPFQFGHIVSAALEKQAGGWGTAGKTLGSTLGTAVRGYRTATAPLAQHATKALPQVAQPAAKAVVTGFGAGATLGQAHNTYNHAADSVMTTAQNMARSTGVTDQKVLDEVGSRARGQMLPMAYRAVAPTWAGGDTTEVGKQIRGTLGTVAQNNIMPVLTRPSQTAANYTPAQRAMQAAIGNPVGAVTSAFVLPRPSAQQLWQNVPQDQRQQMTTNLMSAALEPDAGGSSLAEGVQHIFQPAVQHQQQQLSQQLNSLGSSLAAYTR